MINKNIRRLVALDLFSHICVATGHYMVQFFPKTQSRIYVCQLSDFMWVEWEVVWWMKLRKFESSHGFGSYNPRGEIYPEQTSRTGWCAVSCTLYCAAEPIFILNTRYSIIYRRPFQNKICCNTFLIRTVRIYHPAYFPPNSHQPRFTYYVILY